MVIDKKTSKYDATHLLDFKQYHACINAYNRDVKDTSKGMKV